VELDTRLMLGERPWPLIKGKDWVLGNGPRFLYGFDREEREGRLSNFRLGTREMDRGVDPVAWDGLPTVDDNEWTGLR
jgi:hypothetical protein